MGIEGYDFRPDQFSEVLLRRFFPEKTDHESVLLRQFLEAHGHEFPTKWSASVRIGEAVTVDPSFQPAIRQALERSSKRRIDFVGYDGAQATLVELKSRVGHQVMGQLLSDRSLWVKELPDGPEPRLVAVGRYGTEEDLGILSDHGITVYLFDAPDAR